MRAARSSHMWLANAEVSRRRGDASTCVTGFVGIPPSPRTVRGARTILGSRKAVSTDLRRRAALGVVIALGALAGFVASASAGTSETNPALQAAVPQFGHVFVIVGENKILSQITASAAPYTVNTLKPQGAWLTGYNAVARGSAADYVALTSGQFIPCQTKGPCTEDVRSIFSQLGDPNWTVWNESMPSNCYLSKYGSDANHNAYKPGHNPALTYRLGPNYPVDCAKYDIPAGTTGRDDMSRFNAALALGSVPKYNFVTPNLCEAGYNWCPNSTGARVYGVKEFDNFLKKEIPAIESSPAFGNDGVIFITFDEGTTSKTSPNENTMMLVLGPQVKPGTFSGYYDHYSTVRTIEDGLGLSCLANACTASDVPGFGP